MTNLTNRLFSLLWTVMWVAGIVLAKGFWSTFFAIITGGLWSLYLVVETGLGYMGVLQ